MALPVRGLRPLRSARRLTRKVPKPPMVTFRPRRSESNTLSSRALRAFSAETFEPPDALAIAATSSALTMGPLTTRAIGPKSSADAGAHRLGGRPLQREHAAPRAALHREAAALLLDDAVRDTPTEPRRRPHLLRREERLENARKHLGRDAGAVVGHLRDTQARSPSSRARVLTRMQSPERRPPTPPPRIACSALRIRFRNTCWSWWESPCTGGTSAPNSVSRRMLEITSCV